MIRTSETINLPHTLAEFIEWESNDGFKYEWNDGELIRFSGMKGKHLKLIKKLNRLFLTTQAHKDGGELICEQDVMLNGMQLRRPDIAYFSREQIESGEEVVPEFCIEVISRHDKITEVDRKLEEYFNSNVRVVWLIFIERKVVWIHTRVEHIKCKADQICSASPILKDFKISVNDLLQ